MYYKFGVNLMGIDIFKKKDVLKKSILVKKNW